MQTKIKVMLFADKIRQLREEKQLLQRQLASALEIDTPMYSKIERGDRPAKREQVLLIANILSFDKDELITLWLADQVSKTVENDKIYASKAFDLVNTLINNSYK